MRSPCQSREFRHLSPAPSAPFCPECIQAHLRRDSRDLLHQALRGAALLDFPPAFAGQGARVGIARQIGRTHGYSDGGGCLSTSGPTKPGRGKVGPVSKKQGGGGRSVAETAGGAGVDLRRALRFASDSWSSCLHAACLLLAGLRRVGRWRVAADAVAPCRFASPACCAGWTLLPTEHVGCEVQCAGTLE